MKSHRQKALAIIESTRERQKQIFNEPMPRRDFEEDELIAGNEDQRPIYKSDKDLIDGLWDKNRPKRESVIKKMEKKEMVIRIFLLITWAALSAYYKALAYRTMSLYKANNYHFYSGIYLGIFSYATIRILMLSYDLYFK